MNWLYSGLRAAVPFSFFWIANLALAHEVPQVSFLNSPNIYHTPLGNNVMAVADLNGDGFLDVVTGASGINILFGGPAGSFQPAVSLPNFTDVQAIVIADVNRDGKLDLVVSERDNNDIAVALGRGDGTFCEPIRTPVSAAFALAVADFNGDGRPDVAVSQYAGGTVTILLGVGNGAFLTLGVYPAGTYPASLVAGDFNHDGNIDLVAADQNSLPGAVILLGKGNGAFSPARPVDAGGKQYYVIAADFNNDGNLDLAVANPSVSTTSVLLGNGDGTFQPPLALPQPFPGTLVAADFNGDGKLDIAGETFNGKVGIFLGNGNGTFRYERSFDCGTFMEGIAAGDFNRDGKLDLATQGSTAGGVTILFSDGEGDFTDPPAYAAGLQPNLIHLGDLNHDGFPDAVVASSLSNFNVLLGDGKGGFLPPRSLDAPGQISDFVLADMNGDGNLDIVAVTLLENSTASFVSVFLGLGDGKFGPPINTAIPLSEEIRTGLAVGDLNHDGKLDVVTSFISTTGYIEVLLGAGDGSFQTSTSIPAGASAGPVVLADFTCDGNLDIAVGNANGVLVFLGDGKGGVTSAAFTPLSEFVTSLAAGDLNGDGSMDLVAAVGGINGPHLGAQVLYGKRNGAFTPGPFLPTGDTSYQVAIADLNGDPFPDIIVQNWYFQNTAIVLGSANGFLPPHYFGGGWMESAIAVGDINCDRKPDLVTANNAGNNVSVLLTIPE